MPEYSADGVQLEADATEQAILARIHFERAAGAPLRRIADGLNRDGVRTLLRNEARSTELVAAAA